MLSYAKLNTSECTHVGLSFILITTDPGSLQVCHTTLSQVSLSISRSSQTTSALCSDPRHISSLTPLLLLGLQQTVPVANLLSFRLFHLSPVGELLLSRTVEAEWNPTNHLFALHASLVVHRKDECDVWKLEQGYLEDKRLFVGWIGLAPTDGCLALWHLVAHGVQ